MFANPSSATVRTAAICTFLAMYIAMAHGAQAFPSKSLQENVAASDVAVVAQLTRFTLDPNFHDAYKPPSGNSPLILKSDVKRERGVYTFSISERLKGEVPDKIEVANTYILGTNYGDTKVEIKEGAHFLLLLTHKGDGAWVPTSAVMPFLLLGAEIGAVPAVQPNNDADVTNVVVGLLVESLSDIQAKGSTLFALSRTRDSRIANAAKLLTDEPDINIQANALACLATNQVVEVIPRMAVVEQKLNEAGMGGRLASALKAYKVSEAIPYLNALLIDHRSMWTRINAISAMNSNGLYDKSSIPNLIIVLKDPTSPGQVAYFSHILLHGLIPDLGPAQDSRAFAKERGREIQKIEAWWADEQAGKHGPALVRPRSTTPAIPSTQLNTGSGRGPAD